MVYSPATLKKLFSFLMSIVLVTVALGTAAPSAGWAAPTVTDFDPAEGIIASISTPVSASFSEAMNAGSLGPGSFTVSRFVGIKSVAAGNSHTVALRNDGTVVQWGTASNSSIYGTVPAGLSGVTAIAAGAQHTVALRNDGTIAIWGSQNYYGEMTIPSGLSGVSAVAAGGQHTVVLKSDGTVLAWGSNSFGQCSVPAGLSGVTAIAAGASHTVALKSDGTVVAWGATGTANYGQTAVPVGLTGVTAIAAASYHTVALKDDGTVVAWGANTSGQTTIPTGLSDVMTIAAGAGSTMALKKDGTLVAWGSIASTVPAGLTGFTAMAIGSLHSVAVRNDGTVSAWGSDSSGQTTVPVTPTGITAIASGQGYIVALRNIGTPITWGTMAPAVPADLSGVKAVAAGGYHTVALKNDGTVTAWGNNSYGVTTVPDNLSGVTAISTGSTVVAAVKNDGTVVTWGWNGNGQLNVPAGLSDVIDISVGDSHTVALKSDGTLAAWGYSVNATVPAGLHGVAVSASSSHTLVLKNDKTVAAFGGYNSYGERNIPAGLSEVVAVAAGPYFSLALKSNGTVVAWGANSYGETTVPAGLTDVVAIAAGGSYNARYSAALKKDGTVVTWGSWSHPGGALSPPSSPYHKVVSGSVSYDAGSHTATFTPSAPLELGGTYFATVNTGAKSAAGVPLAAESTWSFLTQARWSAAVTLSDLIHTYDGTLKAATVATVPAGLPIGITYEGNVDAPSEPGAYHVAANVVVPNYQNYQGSAFDMLHISNGTIALDSLEQVYDGSQKVPGTAPTPYDMTVAVTFQGSESPPTNAGEYPFKAVADKPGSHAYATGVLKIAKATPIITWVNPTDISYGTLLSEHQFNASASVPGTFSYTPPAGTLLGAGADQTLRATFTPADTTNYNSVTVSVRINVAKVTPALTLATPADIVYGTPLSATQLNATASVPGTFVYTPSLGTVLNAGLGQTLTATFTPTDAANYNSATASVTINVTRGTPTITWPAPADIVYGTPLSPAQLNAVAPVPGTIDYAPPAGTVLNAGSGQTLTAVFTPTDTANYNGTTATVTINVTKATPAITWPIPGDIIIGTPLSGAQLNATAPVAGIFEYTPASGTELNVGPGQSLSVVFTPTDTANYNGANKSVPISVLKATPTITWANPADISHGTPLSAAQLNATASVPGTFAYTPDSGTVLNAGSGQTLRVTFTPTDGARYNDASKTVLINVKRGAQSVPVLPIPLSTVSSSGLPVTYTVTGPAEVRNGMLYFTGSGTVQVTASQAGNANYDPASEVRWTVVIP